MRLAVSGKVLKQALEHALTGDGPDAHVAGIVVWYDAGKPAGRRLKNVRLANGKDVDDGRTYTLAVSAFLAAGGTGYTLLVGAPPPQEGGAASRADSGAALPSGRLPPPRHDARARAGAGDPAPGGHTRWPRPGVVRQARQEPRGVP